MPVNPVEEDVTKKKTNPHGLLSTAEVAKIAGVSTSTVRRDISVTRRLPATLDIVNHQPVIKRSDAEQYNKERRTKRRFRVNKAGLN
jgi:DeoR/GlpR family transcriptional regulator of sugar metabolism